MVVACSRSESTDVKQDPYKIKSTPTSEPTSKPVPTVPTKDAGLVDDPGAQADIYGAPPPPRTTDAGVAKDAK